MKFKKLIFLAMLLAGQARADYKDTVLSDNPAGYWRLDSIPVASFAVNTGSAGTAANGTIGNFVREGLPGATGTTNKAMQFSGNGNSRIVVPFVPELNPAGSFSFEAWMKPATKMGNALALAVNRSGESGFTVYINGDGTFGFNMSSGGVDGIYWNTATITNSDAVAAIVDKWTHVACVFDASQGDFGTEFIYTNGVLAASNALAGPYVANPSGTLNLGDRNYSGLLDEVAVYDNSLTPEQVQAHFAASAGDYKAAILADNPVGYWQLEETSGFSSTPSVAKNLGSLGAVDNGSYDLGTGLSQPGALAGSANKAVHFDGTHLMSIPPGAAINPDAPFTIEFWTKPDLTYTGATGQASPLSGTDRDFGRSGWLFYQGGNGFSWWLGDATNYTIQLDPVMTVATSSWYHLVGTYDGTTARFYVNGVQVATGNGHVVPNGDKPITIGSRYDGAGYQGSIDEVAIYGAALTPADILAHYNNGINASPTQSYDALVQSAAPLGYWRLDDVALPSFGISNLGFVGSAADGSPVGTLSNISDSPLVGDNNQAMYFGDGGRVSIPYSPYLNETNTFSYEVWYKENGGASGYSCPLWWRDEPVLGDTRGWVHYIVGDPRGNTFQSSDVFTTWNGLSSETLFAQDEWQHLVCTFDGKNKRIYLDGVLISVSTTPVLAVKPVQRAVDTISSASYPFQGSLDEVAIYTNALSADRVQAHWLAARQASSPAVIATFASQPQPVTAFEGSTVKLDVLVLGTPPFTYQWYKDATLLQDKTNSTLTISPALLADQGNYSVKVTNSGGEVSSDGADVTVVTAPATISQDPLPATRLQGSSVTFSVGAGGSQPLTYQWKFNSTPIGGAIGSSLTLTNLQATNAGNYSVTVNNTAGNASSSEVSLTVLPAVAGGHAASIVGDMPVAFWRLDETNSTAYDVVGGHDGVYDDGLTHDVEGAIPGDPDKAVTFPGFGGITVPSSPDLNPFNAFSVELWAKPDPADTGVERTLFSSRTTASGWHYGYYLALDASDELEFITGHKTSGTSTLLGGTLSNQSWYHIVATFDAGTGDKRLYINGVLSTNSNEAVGTFAPNNNVNEGDETDEGIGKTTANDPYIGEGNYFMGDIDDVAIFNYVLSPAQVAQHFGSLASSTLTIAPAGDKVVITWSQGLLLQASEVTGPWSTNTAAASPLTLTPSESRQFFRVLAP